MLTNSSFLPTPAAERLLHKLVLPQQLRSTRGWRWPAPRVPVVPSPRGGTPRLPRGGIAPGMGTGSQGWGELTPPRFQLRHSGYHTAPTAFCSSAVEGRCLWKGSRRSTRMSHGDSGNP